MATKEGEDAPSYRNITVNDMHNAHACIPSFKPLQHLRDKFLQDEMNNNTRTHMDAETSHPKVARAWLPGKCILQTQMTPRYIIKRNKIGEHTHFMSDHALIGKFLGLSPS
jgi:hypothetical protein